MSFKSKTGAVLKETVESIGVQATGQLIREMFNEKKAKPEDFSIKEIHESVNSSDFPVIAGELISSKVIEGYKSTTHVSQELFTIVPSKVQQDKLVRWKSAMGPDRVLEGTPYNDSTLGEAFYQPLPSEKWGRILSITEEAIYFDQTGNILTAAHDLGRQTGNEKEKNVLNGVQDLGTWSGRIYRPGNVDTALFSAAIGNTLTAAFGEAGLEALLKAQDALVDDEGYYISFEPGQMIGLFPAELWVNAVQMVESTLVPEGTEGAKNIFKNMFIPYRSPYVSNASASTWYIGNPKTCFNWMQVWPLETFSMGKQTDDAFTRDISYKFKVREYGVLTAVRPQFWFKCTV
jgi:hypothetical protein